MLKIVSKGNFNSIDQFTFIQDQKLGSGSFGTVRLAIHNGTNRMYALKIISISNLPSDSQIKLIQREIKLHSQVDHPHIIKVWDTFNDAQNIYMVMEFAQMGNLFYYQNTKSVFSEIQAFKFFTQTFNAIKYLHANDIIHRDLKPENLLLDLYYNIKICDFGWSAENIHNKRTTFCGTYQYMAPQMIFRTEYDHHVDIWALGVLLYQMLHGFAPFKGKTIEEVQDSMLKGTYQISPKLSHNAKNLIAKILQFKVDQRLSLAQISAHPWVKQMQQLIKDYLNQQKVKLPYQIHQKIQNLPISLLRLRSMKKTQRILSSSKKVLHHRKNNSMDLIQQDPRNININLSINNFSIVNKKNRQLHHSQEKVNSKQIEDFDNFKQSINQFNSIKTNKKLKNSDMRCRTLVDDQVTRDQLTQIIPKTRIFRHKLSKDNLFHQNMQSKINHLTQSQLNYHTQSQLNHLTQSLLNNHSNLTLNQRQSKRRNAKIDKINRIDKIDKIDRIDKIDKIELNLKKSFKLRKSQDKVEKPVRFNTQVYDKDDQTFVFKLKKNSKKTKVLTSTKNIKCTKAIL